MSDKKKSIFLTFTTGVIIPIIIGVLAWVGSNGANKIAESQAKLAKAQFDASLVSLFGEYYLGSKDQGKRDYAVRVIAELADDELKDKLIVRVIGESKEKKSTAVAKIIEDVRTEPVNWSKISPTEAWCYQEKKKEKYSVHCHWSKSRCEDARGVKRPFNTECVFVEKLNKTNWNPLSGGWMRSWYQDNLGKPYGLPFPQI